MGGKYIVKTPNQSPSELSNITICGVSQYYCDWRSEEPEEYSKCYYEVGPDQYCNTEKVSNKNNNVCGLTSDSQYFCRPYKIWSSDWKDYKKCEAQGVDRYCSNQTSNHNVCYYGSHPKVASSLLFFFLLNYVMGLVTCVRLEGRKWAPLIAALLTVYPQYCK